MNDKKVNLYDLNFDELTKFVTDLGEPLESSILVGSPHCKYVWAGQGELGMEPGSIV